MCTNGHLKLNSEKTINQTGGSLAATAKEWMTTLRS